MKQPAASTRFLLPQKENKPFCRWVVGDSNEALNQRGKEILSLQGLSEKDRQALDTSMKNRELINQMVNAYFKK
jgi:hypothetical protein